MSNSSQGMDVGKMALEGFGKVMDSMDMVKRTWSGFSVPTPFTPTLDVEELDKRIADLRAVEQWLSLNQNMLRTTIQGLEIQRGTLDAIRTMSESFGKALKPADDSVAQTLARFAAAAAQKAVTPPAEDRGTGAGAAAAPASAAGMPTPFDWSPFAMPSAFGAFGRAMAPAAASTSADPESAAGSAAASTAAAPEAGDVRGKEGAAGAGAAEDPPEGAAEDASEGAAEGASSSVPADDSEGAAPPGDVANMQAGPLAWWNMLQENFRQIAQAATATATPDATAGAASPVTGKARAGRTSASSNASTSSGAAAPAPAGTASSGRRAAGKSSRAGKEGTTAAKAGKSGKTSRSAGTGAKTQASRVKPRGTPGQS